MNERIRSYADLASTLPRAEEKRIHRAWMARLADLDAKVVVLDDDPTGIQCVHGVRVYTDWSPESIRQGFASPDRMFFLLTDSRSMTREQTIRIHRDIGRRVAEAAREAGRSYLLISRGDSTLRGHYPWETQALREALEEAGEGPFDGEVILPFFPEGGRYTYHNVHYVTDGDRLIPAGQTEFARDTSFGYRSSDLREWVEEKTGGRFSKDQVISISLAELRGEDLSPVRDKLLGIRGFRKVVVNALTYADVEAFALALTEAMDRGKRFLMRSAAALPKVLGGVEERPLLSGRELRDAANPHGGLVVVGSHVAKTTRQLERLRRLPGLAFLEFDIFRVGDPEGFRRAWTQVMEQAQEHIRRGITAVIYTSRSRLDAGQTQEERLTVGMRIAHAVTDFVRCLEVRPSFILAKGGITSSEIGTRGLGVRCATVMGQIIRGVPVWRTDEGSKFPRMPYIIFPGNVGDDDGLMEVVAKLTRD